MPKNRGARLHVRHPVTGREVAVPCNFAEEACGSVFHIDLIKQDLRKLPRSLLDGVYGNFEAFPMCRIVLMAIMTVVICHQVVIIAVHSWSRDKNNLDIPMLVIMQPANLFSITFLWQFHRWKSLTVKSQR